MKKIFIFILLAVLALNIFDAPTSHAYFRINEEIRDTSYVEGIRHTRVVGSINNNGKESRQVMNYMGANVKQLDNINIVVGDNYDLHQNAVGKWGMYNIHALISNVNNRYEHFEVIGGVNGDFYDINNTGRPLSAHIRNFEVVHRGDTNWRPLVGFKDNGEVVFGRPEFDGYELLVFNDEGQLKKKTKVNNINKDPKNNTEISVYFDNYLSALPEDLNKVVIATTETKITEASGNYFGKGALSTEDIPANSIPEHSFVIVGHEFNNDYLITENDYVVVQYAVKGIFKDVRFALGTDQQPLVIDGKANASLNAGAAWNYAAPRTAVGIKKDGTVFFLLVDGRNFNAGMEGVTLLELGELMAHYGAENAFNLDGGGSSTMALKNKETGVYDILNTPSDNRLRSISNGVFFVKGTHKEIPAPLPAWPDTRDKLEAPGNVFIDRNGVLRFNEVPGSASYSILINGKETVIKDNQMTLELETGLHEISIRAKGGAEYKSSEYTTTLLYQVYPNDIILLIDMIKDFTKSGLTN